MGIECAPIAGTGQNSAWADFIAWGYDIYDASPSITVTADGGTAQTYVGRKLFTDSNAGLYLSIPDTQRLYRQIANATEVVITSTVEAEDTTARAEFTVTGIANAVNTLSCLAPVQRASSQCRRSGINPHRCSIGDENGGSERGQVSRVALILSYRCAERSEQRPSRSREDAGRSRASGCLTGHPLVATTEPGEGGSAAGVTVVQLR